MEPDHTPEQQTLPQLFDDYAVSDQNRQRVMNFFRINDEEGLIRSNILGNKGSSKGFWKQLQKFKDILQTRYSVEQGEHKMVVAVIMGGCGCGKTATVNKLCKTKFKSGENFSSYTDEITFAKIVGDIPGKMVIYDTPGTDSTTNIAKHSNLIYASLTHKPLNVIFVITKWRERGMHVVQDMKLQIECLGNVSQRVVFLVSMVDKAEGSPNTMINEIKAEMEAKGMKQQVVFFSNIRCDDTKLVQTLFNIASTHPNTPVVLDEMEFFRNFRVPALDKKHAQDQEKIIREMADLTEGSLSCARDIIHADDLNKDLMLGELGVELRMNLEQKVEQFQKLANEMMDEHQYYRAYFTLQKMLLDCNERFTRTTQPALSKAIQPATPEKPNILDQLKACPNCKNIWMRSEACPITTCGARPTNLNDWSRLSNFNYQIKRDKNWKVSLTQKKLDLSESMLQKKSEVQVDIYKKYKKKIEQLQMEEQLIELRLKIRGKRGETQEKRIREINESILEQTMLMHEEQSEMIYGKKVGCGFKMDFSLLPRLPDIEKRLQQWYGVNDINDIDIQSMTSKKILEQQEEVKRTVAANLDKLNEKEQNASIFPAFDDEKG